MGALVVIEIIISYAMGTNPELSIDLIIGELWIAIILYIMTKPYEGYHIAEINIPKNSIEKYANVILVSNMVSLVIAGFVAYLTFTTFDNYSLYKGQHDLSQDFLQSLPISTKFLTVSYILGSTYPICLALHFYYLYTNKWAKSILCLIGSLSFPVRMLAYFSRASFITLGIIYVAYTILIYPILSKKAKRIFSVLGIVFSTAILAIFVIISINRFGEIGSSIHDEESSLYSFADYASQWYGNSISVLPSYQRPAGGELSDVFFDYWGLSDGDDNTTVRSKLWPNYYWRFIALPVVMLFDFGVIFSLIFSLLYAWICNKLRPKNNQISLFSFLVFGALAVLPLSSFSGSILEDLSYHYTIIAVIISYFYFKSKHLLGLQ